MTSSSSTSNVSSPLPSYSNAASTSFDSSPIFSSPVTSSSSSSTQNDATSTTSTTQTRLQQSLSSTAAGSAVEVETGGIKDTTKPQPNGVMRVKVKSARFVTTWRWTVADQDDVCGICRLAFESCCPTCSTPGDDCPPMVGACKHAFHMHCIMTWLQAKDKEQVCPLCRREWDIGVT